MSGRKIETAAPSATEPATGIAIKTTTDTKTATAARIATTTAIATRKIP